MNFLLAGGGIVAGYLIGAIPFGFLIVKIFKGVDVRDIQSGRTGGTNTMRAAGFWAGLATAVLDISKNAAAVFLAKALVPDNIWVHVLAAVAGIIGHNYSLYISRKDKDGKWEWNGGAGGSVALGGAIGLWPPSGLIILLMGILIFYFVGYASVTTMSVAGFSILIFGIRAWMGSDPWEYIVYGVISLALLVWALRPNIKRLLDGTERLHGFRLQMQERKERNNK